MSNYNNDERPRAGRAGRLAFGVFMALFYVVVGVLFLCNVFSNLFNGNDVISYILGGILVVYGIWRGYRLYKGGY